MSRSDLVVMLLILGVPLGAGPQNGILGLVLVICGLALRRSNHLRRSFREFHLPVVAGACYLIWAVGVDFFANQEPVIDSVRYFLGFALWIVTPLIAAPLIRPASITAAKPATTAILVVGFVWVAVSLWQYLYGYKIDGWQLIDAQHFRASGLYSHPLTLAYSVLLLWPLFLFGTFRQPSKPLLWFGLIVCAVLLYLSMSRTALAVALLILGLGIFTGLTGRLRALLIAIALVGLGGLAITDNPVKDKFVGTFSGEGFDRHGSYPDDRLAFWHAHYEIWKDAPLAGHGFHWNDQKRAPYYEQIGLGNFPKHYTAHNQYLQTAVNSGLVGLFLLLYWFAWHWQVGRRHEDDYKDTTAKIRRYTLLAFALGCVTQNAFFDAEVRYVLTVLTTFLWAYEFEERRLESFV